MQARPLQRYEILYCLRVIRHPIADDIYQTLALLMRCKIPEYGLEGLRQEWNEMDLAQDAWLPIQCIWGWRCWR